MEIFAKVTKADVNVPTTRPSPVVGASWTDSLEGTIGVATHHDGMSGTERQSVSDDYSQRISESHFEVEAGVALALQRFSGSNNTFGHCNCNEAGNCLNISVCSYTTSKNSFTAVAWNPLGQPTTDTLINVPVTGGSWKIVDSQTGKVIPSQCTPLDNRTLSLPLLYINYYKMSPRKAAAAEAAMQNPATHVLSFVAALPAVGYASFEASVLADGTSEISSTAQKSQPATVSNGIYELTLDWQNNVISSIKNLKSGVESPLTLDWGYYTSNKGGCSYFNNGTKFGCKSKQASGAYLFRPINQTTLSALDDYGQGYGKPTMNVITGSLFTEIRQEYSKYATHVIRMKQNSAYVEIEWTAGPIPGGPISLPPLPAPGGCVGWKQTQQCNAHGPPDPTHDKPCNQSLPSIGNSGYCLCAKNVKVYGSGCGGPSGVKNCNEACSRPVPQFKLAEGKEVVLKVGTDVKSQGTFYTDSNGREMVRRGRDKRGPSYPPLVVNEPVAGNYYPVNSMISLDDGDIELALVTDVSMGGSSMVDGELEVMLHRRIQTDDHRGVQEPLNETMCGCNDIGAAPGSMGAHGHEGDGGCECAGLTMRGSVYLIFDKMDEAHAVRRQLIESLNFPPTLAFTTGPLKKPTYSAVSTALPANVKLMTLTSNYADVHGGAVLLRLAHMYAVDEHSTLSAPATVDLKALFQNSGFSVSTATEMTVTGNQPRSNFKPFSWPTEDVTGGHMRTSANVADVRIPFNPRDMVATLRPMEVKTFLITFA